MYSIKEEREIEPEAFVHLVSSALYERHFGPYFVEPVIAGLSKTFEGELDVTSRHPQISSHLQHPTALHR